MRTESGKSIPADLVSCLPRALPSQVILAIGVRPEVALARSAGLEIGSRGGIKVDSAMRTSRPNIWAVGDAVETHDTIADMAGVVPLAGPANRSL